MSYTDDLLERRNRINKERMDGRKFEEPVYTTGLAAKKLGISTHTLRLYETEGLIISHKTETGRRLYSELEIEKIRGIREMIQNEGHNFEGIRRMIAMTPCWKIRGCSPEDKELCLARRVKKQPCWNSEQPCNCKLSSCRDCPVYQNIIDSEDIYGFINS